MKLIDSVQEMRECCQRWRQEGKRIGFVPTMGWFHEGHLALMREASRRSDRVVVSLFVNPIQFGPNEDFDAYPRGLDRDMELARQCGVDVLYHPSASEMYPDGFQTSIGVAELSVGLCGGTRPGHFDGVCTVVAKLFNQVQPHMAVFGKKDFQQLAVIRRMVKDLDLDVEILGYPIVREEDGLAMSSRNSYLSSEERQKALCLYEAIRYGRRRVKEEKTLDLERLQDEISERINRVDGCRVDYVAIVDASTLMPCRCVDGRSVLVLAVLMNDRIRLIDNGNLVE